MKYYSRVIWKTTPHEGSLVVLHNTKYETKEDYIVLSNFLKEQLKNIDLVQDIMIVNILTFKNK